MYIIYIILSRDFQNGALFGHVEMISFTSIDNMSIGASLT